MPETPEQASPAPPCVLVIFGASGDLARRKLLPALYALDRDGLLDPATRVVGFARSPHTDESFRAEARAAAEEFAPGGPDAGAWPRFAERLHYLTGDYGEADSYARLARLIAGLGEPCRTGGVLYYLALPPAAAETVLERFHAGRGGPSCPTGERCRVVVEKPFGTDLASARRLNALCAASFSEGQIYRADHYLAKDTVRNLLVFRLGNAVFEHLWNRKYVDSVQITAAERIGVESRGGYYDAAGVVRDMLQSHLLQVMALVAMEPPLAGDAESVRDRAAEVFRSLAPLGPGDFVFGQYRGYRSAPGVAGASRTPTFAAVRLRLANWRWEGVPFYLRSGKCLAEKVTEVVIGFKGVPACVLGSAEACARLTPNRLVIRLQPDEGVRLSFCTRVPGRGEDQIAEADLDFRYTELGRVPGEAYERVILDVLAGRSSYFWRADGVEAAWRAVAPMLEPTAGEAPPEYEPGSWGPAEAGRLLAGDGRRWLPGY
jgi:glucose-6-phosphate 1-dehydrogenase